MGKIKQETTIPQAAGAESQVTQFLLNLMRQSGGQLGNLEQLAAGNVGSPTPEDLSLIESTIGHTRDIAKRDIMAALPELQAQLQESLASRGVEGSTIEAVNQGILRRDALRQVADAISQSSIAGGQAALNLPFQRAATQLSANQQLFNQITGAGVPVLQAGVAGRSAQPTTTQSGFNPLDLLKLGLSV